MASAAAVTRGTGSLFGRASFRKIASHFSGSTLREKNVSFSRGVEKVTGPERTRTGATFSAAIDHFADGHIKSLRRTADADYLARF